METLKSKCPICEKDKKEKNKYCSFACRNRAISRRNNYEEISKKVSKTYENRKFLINLICEKCGNNFTIKSTSTGNILRSKRKCCSRKCSNSLRGSHTQESKNKISLKLTKIKKCKMCNGNFTGHRKFCSDNCLKNYRRRNSTEFQKYKSDSLFKFSLNDYPNEFDFRLIEEYGWYKASNHGNNLGGVSRDHIFSITEGFKRKIVPSIIAHPANCRLMIHSKNSSKHKKCDVTLEELLDKIKNWNIKYPK